VNIIEEGLNPNWRLDLIVWAARNDSVTELWIFGSRGPKPRRCPGLFACRIIYSRLRQTREAFSGVKAIAHVAERARVCGSPCLGTRAGPRL
jgi:hypothetical protein